MVFLVYCSIEIFRSEKDDASKTTDSQSGSEKGSTLSSFTRVFNRRSSKEEVEEDRDKDETEDEKKNESLIVYVTRKIRNKLIARKLVGQIFVHRLSGVVVTKMNCSVLENDLPTDENDTSDPIEELSGNFKRAITMTDTVLNSLERRSRAWDGAEFIDNVTLTRGVTIGVSDPIVGLIGFSWTFEITCTVKSLLASRKRFEAARESIAQMYPPGSRSSSFSFSLSSSKQLEKLRTIKPPNSTTCDPNIGDVDEEVRDSVIYK